MNVWGFRSKTRRKSISVSASRPSNLWENAAEAAPWARRSISSKPTLWRVPWYLLPGLPRPTTNLIVLFVIDYWLLVISTWPWTVTLVSNSVPSRCLTDPDPSPGRATNNQGPTGYSSFSFSLRSGLITSGWVGDSTAASAVGSGGAARTTTWTSSTSGSASTVTSGGRL